MRLSAFTLMFLMGWAAGCEKTTSMQTENRVAKQQIEAQAAAAGPVDPHTAVMYVYGMGCPQCAYNVDLQLLKVKGVQKVRVDMSNGRVLAQLSPDAPPTREQLADAIKQTGFTLIKLEMN